MLIGKYEQNIDPKGRVNIPAKFRSALGETFVVAVGEEKCACIYPVSEWDAFMERVNAVDAEDRAMLMRYIQQMSAECSLDSQGRVVMPPQIREYAELQKEIVVVGEQKKIEIWSLDNWNRYSKEQFDMAKISGILKQIGI